MQGGGLCVALHLARYAPFVADPPPRRAIAGNRDYVGDDGRAVAARRESSLWRGV